MGHPPLRKKMARPDWPHANPLRSKEFYKTVDAALRVQCAFLELIRQKGAPSLWARAATGGTLFFEIYIGPKNSWLPGPGGRFHVNLDVVRTGRSKARHVDTAISPMEYYSRDDLQAMRQLRDRVLRKILSQTNFAARRLEDELYRSMFETSKPLLRIEMKQPIRKHQVFALPYLDTDDVTEWGEFFAARLEKTIRGVERNPRFLFTDSHPVSE